MSTPDIATQIGPCGITCGTCFLGSGKMVETMKEADNYINISGIKEWASEVPGGSEINWTATQDALGWMQKYAYCAGCEKGGGPPSCGIRVCAAEKGYASCSMCEELESCTRFDWLGDPDGFKEKLKKNKGKSRQELVREALEA